MAARIICFSLLKIVVFLQLTSTSSGLGKGIIRNRTGSLSAELQRCFTPKSILENVGRHINADTDPQGILSSLVLVRLSKQLISIGNMRQTEDLVLNEGLPLQCLIPVVNTLSSSDWIDSPRSLDAAVEGTKASSTLLRCLPDIGCSYFEPLLEKWEYESNRISPNQLLPHQLSGLKWSFDCFKLNDPSCMLPSKIQDGYDGLNLPFRIRPAFLDSIDGLSLDSLVGQVDFKVDDIRTNSNQVVKERRKTAWEGDLSVGPFFYSGKSMERQQWSPLVLDIRDRLHASTGYYYDGCLLNLYPDGDSGMRYHIDPDQGTLWDYETAVVSIGATRKFAFREITKKYDNHNGNDKRINVSPPHVFTLMHGDVTEMFSDCQERFQHTVKTSEGKVDTAARASLVFKKSLTT